MGLGKRRARFLVQPSIMSEVVRVHAGGEGVGSVAEADGAAAAFDVAGEGYVFEDFAADGAMASDGEVGFALDEEELAVGGGEARCRDR